MRGFLAGPGVDVGNRHAGAFARNRMAVARHLVADAIEHPPVDVGDRRRDPGEVRGMDHDPLRKIGIELHSLPALVTNRRSEPTPQHAWSV
jgi:hypothetical protein